MTREEQAIALLRRWVDFDFEAPADGDAFLEGETRAFLAGETWCWVCHVGFRPPLKHDCPKQSQGSAP